MGVPSGWLCWLHNSGVSTPSLFSQSKNTLGLSLNHLPISFPRPNLKPIFFPFPLSLPNLHTMSYITPHCSQLTAKSTEGYIPPACQGRTRHFFARKNLP